MIFIKNTLFSCLLTAFKHEGRRAGGRRAVGGRPRGGGARRAAGGRTGGQAGTAGGRAGRPVGGRVRLVAHPYMTMAA